MIANKVTNLDPHKKRIVMGDKVGHWVAGKAGGKYFPASSAALGLVSSKIHAGATFDFYNGANIQLTLAVEDSLSKRFLKAIADYCFNHCKVKRITVIISEKNVKSVSLTKKAGFEYECTLKDGHPDGDMLVFRMFKEDCRWLP